MAVAARRLPENAPGPFFVDDSCIDCAKCREVAPPTFADNDRGASFEQRRSLERLLQRLPKS